MTRPAGPEVTELARDVLQATEHDHREARPARLALKPTTALPEIAAELEERTTTRIQALTALKDWYEEWSANARSVVKKRSYLIRLGLASRRVRKGEEPEDEPSGNDPK